MIFLVSWGIAADKRDRVLSRFASDPQLSLKGATILGRWHRVDGTGGCMVVKADSMHPVTEFTYDWGELLFAEIVPVAEDRDLPALLSRLQAKHKYPR